MKYWLRKKREDANLTQEQLAIKVGIARSTYGAIETGERNVRPHVAKKIASILDFDWTLFFEEECHEMKNDNLESA
ncbi:helix-turn-helix transcriptional regulator [Bacillus subtilis]|uniref:helix-turn-helix transcriptional regulator n=1 Tax=Bacillus TaxID=1386 RepID=UPI001BABEAC5|nr:helix-turn-helix transcriptional regulator [Bacillus subtilis]MBR0019381.1 helix-turn-helix transcriptional regulator [Bacillus subtilis]MEC3693671.1 helix-turn-helix transcriptional regulator [Bacillus subtilis]